EAAHKRQNESGRAHTAQPPHKTNTRPPPQRTPPATNDGMNLRKDAARIAPIKKIESPLTRVAIENVSITELMASATVRPDERLAEPAAALSKTKTVPVGESMPEAIGGSVVLQATKMPPIN